VDEENVTFFFVSVTREHFAILAVATRAVAVRIRRANERL